MSTPPSRDKPFSWRAFAANPWLARAAVALLAIAASVVGIANEFVSDDVAIITANPRLHTLANARELFSLPFWPPPFPADLYRPITALMAAVEYALGNGSPLAFRIVSYLLYAACAVAVFELAKRWLPAAPAFAAAALFAVHPVHVEAVALAIGQGELVVTLLGVLMCVRYIDKRRAGSLSVADWTLLALMYAVACLAKENGLILPAFLICAEAFMSPSRGRVRALAPGYGALAAIGIAVLLVRRHVLGDFSGTFTAEALVGLGVFRRAVAMLAVIPQWMRLLIWPAHLRADYSPQELVAQPAFGIMNALGLAILLAGVAICVRAAKRAPALAFGILWCAAGLFPVSNIVVPTGILVAERTLFLPSVGVVIVLAAAAWKALGHAKASRVRYAPLALAACTVLVALGLTRSVARERSWRNTAFFAAQAVADSPRSFRAQMWLGDALNDAGQSRRASAVYQRSLALAPAHGTWYLRNDIARVMSRLGNLAGAADEWRASLAQRPDQEFARGILITEELSLGRYSTAKADADTALARRETYSVFSTLRSIADSATKAGAPAGTVEVELEMGPSMPVR